MKIQAYGKNIIVKEILEETPQPGGIVLPNNKSEICRGIVLSAGASEGDELFDMGFEKGDTIFYFRPHIERKIGGGILIDYNSVIAFEDIEEDYDEDE